MSEDRSPGNDAPDDRPPERSADQNRIEPLPGEPARVLAGAAPEIDDPPAGSFGECREQERALARETGPPVDGAVVVQKRGDGEGFGSHGRPDDIACSPLPGLR